MTAVAEPPVAAPAAADPAPAPKFAVGQIVRIISVPDEHPECKGKRARVLLVNLETDQPFPSYELAGEWAQGWETATIDTFEPEDRFTFYEDELEAVPQAKFKIGDFVKIVADAIDKELYKGVLERVGKSAQVVKVEEPAPGNFLIGIVGEWDERWLKDPAACEMSLHPEAELVLTESPMLVGAAQILAANVIGDAYSAAARAALDATGTVLSPSDRAFLARHNAIEAAAVDVEDAEAKLAEAMEAEENAKAVRKAAEVCLEAANRQLLRAVRDEPDAEQGVLPFGEACGTLASPRTELSTPQAPSPAADAYEAAQQAWEKKWDAFLAQPLSVLKLSDSLEEKFTTNDPAVTTLKGLTDLYKKSEGHGYTVVKGIGKGKSDVIQDAFDRVQNEFLAANPQPVKPVTVVRGEEAASGYSDSVAVLDGGEVNAAQPGADATEGAVDPAPVADYDFETTFPAPLNPTANESYDLEYHRGIINEAVAQQIELRGLREQLGSNTAPNGTPLSPKKRKAAETAQGETQVQYDETFEAYANTFGRPALWRLQTYVEKQAEKKTSLKGGLG